MSSFQLRRGSKFATPTPTSSIDLARLIDARLSSRLGTFVPPVDQVVGKADVKVAASSEGSRRIRGSRGGRRKSARDTMFTPSLLGSSVVDPRVDVGYGPVRLSHSTHWSAPAPATATAPAPALTRVPELVPIVKTLGLTGPLRAKYTNPVIALPPHLRQDTKQRYDLIRRVDAELQRCCSTTQRALQAKINKCKYSLVSCRDIANDSKLSSAEKLPLYAEGMSNHRECREYREQMNRAFNLQGSTDDYWESETRLNHHQSASDWRDEEEVCRRYYNQATNLKL